VCKKRANRYQLFLNRSLLSFGGVKGSRCRLTNFFPIVDTTFCCKDIFGKSLKSIPKSCFAFSHRIAGEQTTEMLNPRNITATNMIQLHTTDFAPGAATWRFRGNRCVAFDSGLFPPFNKRLSCRRETRATLYIV